jgi:hypothetical protein
VLNIRVWNVQWNISAKMAFIEEKSCIHVGEARGTFCGKHVLGDRCFVGRRFCSEGLFEGGTFSGMTVCGRTFCRL